MTQAQPRNFLGIPIEGDVYQSRSNSRQRPVEELQPLLRAVLDDPTVYDFGWRQYTPYFNDGDTCEFGIHGMWLRTVEDAERFTANDEDENDFDVWEYEIGSGHPSLGREYSRWDHEVTQGRRLEGEYEGPDKARYERCCALSRAIEGGEFKNVLYNLFGDHASITFRKDKIVVDEYSHD